MVAIEAVSAVLVLVLLVFSAAMAIVGLLGVIGAIRLGRCPSCQRLVPSSTPNVSTCPYCSHARLRHPHLGHFSHYGSTARPN